MYQFSSKEQIQAVWQSWDMLGLLEQIKDVISLPNGSYEVVFTTVKTTSSLLLLLFEKTRGGVRAAVRQLLSVISSPKFLRINGWR
jgi:tRNA threonylcarbamoyladenosine modification (KEOPS) complex Cgi121 subunit